MKFIALPLTCATVTAISGAAAAQWTTVILHPIGPISSTALGSGGGQQVGFTFTSPANQIPNAAVWNGTAQSWVTLSHRESRAYGVDGGVQVGSERNGISRAVLWRGTESSGLSLHPIGPEVLGSEALGVGDGQQVGTVGYPGRGTPALWNGTADSYVNLTPFDNSPFVGGIAYGAGDGQQVGTVSGSVFGVNGHAALWSGTAESFVDLNPLNGTAFEAVSSRALDVERGMQVGWARFDGFVIHESAAMWTGSSVSWVNLDPLGSSRSHATGTDGFVQVGFAVVDGEQRASLWNGSAESWVDLSLYLPEGYTSSSASGVWSDGDIILISGTAHHSATGWSHAVLWMSNSHRLCADQNTDGLVTPADFSAWIANFNAQIAVADTNQDGIISPADFSAWISAFNQGDTGPICVP